MVQAGLNIIYFFVQAVPFEARDNQRALLSPAEGAAHTPKQQKAFTDEESDLKRCQKLYKMS